MSWRSGWWRWVVALLVVCASLQAAGASAFAGWGTTFDPTFGDRGVVSAQLAPGVNSAATSVALAPDGDVLVGASVGTGASMSGELVRLLPDGAFDPSFGVEGQVTFPGLSGVSEVAATPSGGVLALGGSLVELNADGTADGSFGSGGVAALPASFVAQRFALAPAGQIVVFGTASLAGGGSAPAVVRLTSAGEPDPSFGADGVFVLPQPLDEAEGPLTSVALGGLAIQPDGAVVVVEVGTYGTPNDEHEGTVLERVSASGALDSTFGADGQASVQDDANSVGTFNPVVAPDGEVIVPVWLCAGIGGPDSPTLLAFTPAGQQLDTQELGCGIEYSNVGALVALPGGGYLASGGDDAWLAFLYPFRPDLAQFPHTAEPLGANDTIGPLYGGALDPDGSLLAVEPDGRLIVAGSVLAANGQRQLFVARVLGFSQAIVSLPSQPIHREPGSVTLRLGCAPAQACRGRAELTEPHLLVGSGEFSIDPATSGHVTISLTQAGRSRLREHRLNRVTLTLAPAHGPRRTATLIIPRPT